jgi:hypothetical protein
MGAVDGLRIGATKRADATRIAEALAEFESRVEPEHDEWVVVVPAVVSHALTTAVLDALQSCLHGAEIAAVKVTLDGRTYVMDSL